MGWRLQGGAAAFRSGGAHAAIGEDSGEVLRLGEEEREVRRQSNRSENRGDTHSEKGVGGGAPAGFMRRPASFDARGGQKAPRGSGGGGL
jgi:hypothetical protein